MAQLYLHVPLDGAHDYPVGDEIWHYGLDEAIALEADATAYDAGADLLEANTDSCRNQLRQRVIDDMTDQLHSTGDRYTAPDGVRYSLTLRND